MGFLFTPRTFTHLLIVLAMVALTGQAPAQTSSSSKPTKKSSSGKTSPLDSGSVSNGVYRNPGFGFSCKIPEGWVLRTEEMNEGATREGQAGAGTVLLAAFSRPPLARGEDVNSSIVIAAESASAYPGLKEAVQYLGVLEEVPKSQGFTADGEPAEIAIDAKTLVREDFHKDVGSRVMQQAMLAMLARGYAISFTFIGGSEDEVEELVEGLSFAGVAKASH
jgi:hypothetical protein